jgi:hypothetical protein
MYRALPMRSRNFKSLVLDAIRPISWGKAHAFAT